MENALLSVNALLRWLFNRLPGYGEPIVGPLGPYLAASLRADPESDPWRVRNGVQNVVAAVQARDIASRIKEGPIKELMAANANASIAAVLDDFCGTPPPHWPWPGGSPEGWQFVSGLATAANAVASAELRGELLNVASQAAVRLAAGGRDVANR